MAKSKYLKMAAETLKQAYFIEQRDDKAISVSTDPESLPFAFVVVEPNYPKIFLLSLRVGFNDPVVVSDITLVLNNITTVEIVDEFFIDDNQEQILWGQDAHIKTFEMDHNEFLKLEPINNLKH